MILLDDSLAQLYHAGRITEDEALNRCRNMEDTKQKLTEPPRSMSVSETDKEGGKGQRRPIVKIETAAQKKS
jgi:hypothetical protein